MLGSGACEFSHAPKREVDSGFTHPASLGHGMQPMRLHAAAHANQLAGAKLQRQAQPLSFVLEDKAEGLRLNSVRQ